MAKPNGEKMDAARLQAFQNLNIAPGNRAILCLDGGGMRGILTVQLLKKLESIAGLPCYKIFDMVAGTSTGAIIAGLITTGHAAVDIEQKYMDLVTEVFDQRKLGNRFVNPPAFTKELYRKQLSVIVDDLTLAQACATTDTDLMITSRDIAAGEETFFSCFKQADGSFYGTYKDILLRSAMEATMSAPTYFYPLERFLDGGCTTYNNPALAAFMEAVSYSTPDKDEKSSAYQLSAMTLFSFGTGVSRQFIPPDGAINPHGIDVAFWLNWIMEASTQDASAMQIDTFRSPMIRTVVEFRRFQISLDPAAIGQLPNIGTLDEHKYHSQWLHDLKEDVLGNIDMADTTRFDLMQVIGQQLAEYIVSSGNGFRQDLVDGNNRDKLVTAFGDIARIQKQLSTAQWLDGYKA